MKKIHPNTFPFNKRKALLGSTLAVSALFLLPGHGIAQTANLSNGGSAMTVDLTGNDGVNSWTVDTSPVNQLDSEWFYYSINGGAAQPINSLGLVPGSDTVTGGNVLSATYNNGSISVQIGFTLSGSGSGSGQAALTANLLTVTSTSDLTSLNVYEYANFNLLQSYDNGISISPSYTAPPPFGTLLGYNGIQQTSGSTALSETIGSPLAEFAEAGTTTQILNDITAGGNLTGPVSVTATPDTDVAWGLEWSYQGIAANQMETVLQNQTLSIATVPEPSSIAMIALGLGACGFLRRRQS